MAHGFIKTFMWRQQVEPFQSPPRLPWSHVSRDTVLPAFNANVFAYKPLDVRMPLCLWGLSHQTVLFLYRNAFRSSVLFKIYFVIYILYWLYSEKLYCWIKTRRINEIGLSSVAREIVLLHSCELTLSSLCAWMENPVVFCGAPRSPGKHVELIPSEYKRDECGDRCGRPILYILFKEIQWAAAPCSMLKQRVTDIGATASSIWNWLGVVLW